NAMGAGAGEQALRRLVQGLETETESSVMHRHKRFRTQFAKRFNRFFRIHVNLPASRRVVSANRQQSDIDVVIFADFAEPGKVSTVTAMKNGASIDGNDKPAKTAMQISEKSGPPMVTGR